MMVVEKMEKDIEDYIDKNNKFILFPYGNMAKKIEPLIREKTTELLIADNHKDGCLRVGEIEKPNSYKWIIAVEGLHLYLELYDEICSLGVDANNIFDPYNEMHDLNRLIHVEKCPICGCKEHIQLSADVLRCSNCTHGYREYIPNEILGKYYDKKYWEDDKNRQGIYEVKEGNEWSDWLGDRLQELESFNLLNSSIKNILEFGCSEGMLLYELKKRGFEVMGNDVCAISEESASNLGINISNLPVEEFSKLDYKYDLIMSYHVMEHLRNPLEIIMSLSNMLSPGGKMFMHIPIDDIELTNMDHYHFFTEQSAKKLMEYVTEGVSVHTSYYNISKTEKAMVGTFVGTKKNSLD